MAGTTIPKAVLNKLEPQELVAIIQGQAEYLGPFIKDPDKVYLIKSCTQDELTTWLNTKLAGAGQVDNSGVSTTRARKCKTELVDLSEQYSLMISVKIASKPNSDEFKRLHLDHKLPKFHGKTSSYGGLR